MLCVRRDFAIALPMKLVTSALCGLALVIALGAPGASAQSYSLGVFSSSERPPSKPKKPRAASKASDKPDTKKADAGERAPEGPLVLTVSLRAQRVQVFDANGLVTSSPISSGRVGNPTPMGVYTILAKEKMHYSNLYGSAPMPNMNRITWSGVALHAGDLPGYPASHGCIRLPYSFSSKLYGMTRVGYRVVVARDPLIPEPISHPALFTAAPPLPAPATAGGASVPASSQVADASNGSATKDIAPQGSAVSVALGVTPAAAAEAAPAPGSYREKWLAEMARLAAAIPEAQANKVKAIEALKVATAALDDGKDDVKLARDEADRKTAERKKAERALAAANDDLKSYIKRMSSNPTLTEETAQKAGEAEDALEKAIADRTKELDDAVEAESKAAAAVKDTEAALAKGEQVRKDAADAAQKADAAVAAAVKADASAKRREAKRANPISVFVSLKSQKLSIRQGQEPIYEGPVTIADPQKPIGTHVFTALAVANSGTDVKWSVVSVPTPPPGEKSEPAKKRKKGEPEPAAAAAPAPAPQTAKEALDRITFPDNVRELVSDAMKPGSSLLISDYGLSNETGEFTDFIVSLR